MEFEDSKQNQIATEIDGSEAKATNFGAQAVGDGLTREEWNRIEERVPSFQKSVLDALVKCANDVIRGSVAADSSVENNLKRVLGENFYKDVRPDLVKAGLVKAQIPIVNTPSECKSDVAPDEKTKNKAKKVKAPVVKKADQIRAQNAAASVKKEIVGVVNSLSYENLQPNVAFNSHYIEVVGLGFVYMARYMIRHVETFKREKNVKQVWSMMVSMQRFIEACANYMGVDPISPGNRSKISQVLIADMQVCYKDMDAVFPFDGIKICQRAPELLVYAPLDQYVSATAIKPRNHQVEIVQKVHNHFKTGFFIVYNAMINSGKTTSVVSVADVVKHHGKILMCVCNLQTVREQMCNMLYNANKNFAVGYIRHDGMVKLSQTWSKKNEKIDVIICDPVTAEKLLSDKEEIKIHGSADQYVVFHDEPTVGADIADSFALRENVLVQMNLPPRVIFSSATAPTVNELSMIIDRLREKCPSMVVDTVYSPTVQVGCEVRTETGELVVPYLGCKTKDDVLSTIKKIEDIPFLGRMLTTEVALHLWTELNKRGIKNVPDIPVMFRKVSNMKADKVREVVIDMLRLISALPNSRIEEICSSELLTTSVEKTEPEEKVEDNGLGFEWDRDEEETEQKTDSLRKVDYRTLGTSHVWRGMTLVVSTDPVNFARENFAPLLNTLHDARVRSASHVIGIYDRDYAEWAKKKEKTLKNMEESETDKAFKEVEIDEMAPTFKLPAWAQIGTVDHCRRFVPKEARPNVVDTRSGNNPEALITRRIEYGKGQAFRFVDGTKVHDDLLLLLFCGVGVYAPSNSAVDNAYTNLILEYANAGRLAYVVADNSITFGTNQPYGRVMICDDFSKKHSVYTLFQLMGRAGRVGKFPRAEAVVSDEAGRLLVDFTVHPERYNIEVVNIVKMINNIEKEQNDKLDEQIRRMESLIIKEEKSTNTVAEVKIELVLPKPTPTSPKTEVTSAPVKDHVIPESWEDDEAAQTPPPTISSKTVPVVPLKEVIRPAPVSEITRAQPEKKPVTPVQKSEEPLSWRQRAEVKQDQQPPTRSDSRPDNRVQVQSTHVPQSTPNRVDTGPKKYVPPALRQQSSQQDNGRGTSSDNWRSGRSDNQTDSRQDSRSDNRQDSWRSGRSDSRSDNRSGNGSNNGRSSSSYGSNHNSQSSWRK